MEKQGVIYIQDLALMVKKYSLTVFMKVKTFIYDRVREMRLSVLISIYKKEKPEYFEKALKSIWDDQIVKPDKIVLVKDGKLTSELEGGFQKWQIKIPNGLKIVGYKIIRG